MKNLFKFLLMLIFSITSASLFAETGNSIWTNVSEGSFPVKGERRIVPQHYKTVRADLTNLKSMLLSAPFEFSDRAKNEPLIIELPGPDGQLSKFYLTEYSMMEPELAAKYPDFKTYNVKGMDDPYAVGKLDITMHGFHAMVLSPRGDFFIDPYSTNEKEIYISYYKRDFASAQRFQCEFDESIHKENFQNQIVHDGTITCGPQLRTYRLANAATGEYTVYHGGTVQAGMAAIVTAINRVSGVYEKEFAVRMTLVANNDLVVYTSGGTDPYSNNNGSAMLAQNQTTLDNVIGSANYDIGHVFSTGGGGIAYLGCVCSASTKARGVTGLPQPTGDPFYIDYVAHEMGHQYGGNHSFNSIAGACGGGNRNAATAWEPGSGSTIMAYAGICGEDLQNNSDAYFHSGNFSEMSINIQLGQGSLCPVVTNTNNTPPTVVVPAGGWVIPKSTPFKLTGSATDVETPNSITYCWEEMDLGPAGSPNNPSGDAPIFRSFKPDTSSTRLFPKLSNLLNNTQTIGEILPTYTRNLSFRLTARDNASGGGGVNYEYLAFSVEGNAGPFLVSQPNTNVTWNSNIQQTVTWSVANTNVAPVSCADVKITLSTDGGVTWPTVLVASTPNDGSEAVNLPSINTATARIRVESIGNVFFDLSNTNFTITNASSVQNIGNGIPQEYSLLQNYPNPFNPVTNINFDLPENSNVTIKIMDITGKEVATLVNGKYSAGSYNVTFDGAAFASGIYFYKITTNNFVQTKKMTLLK